MKRSQASVQRLYFVLLCLIWGSTWLALKIGAVAVPPGIFSGTRWTVAGLLLLLWQAYRGEPLRVRPDLWPRIVLVGLLMISLTAMLLMYGLRGVGSGLASVVNAALTPLSLLGFSVLGGQERWSSRQLGAMGLGVLGILVLFRRDAFGGSTDMNELLGIVGVILSCLCYAGGSVLIRPLMRSMAPAHAGGVTNLVGGIALLAFSVPFEPGAQEALSLRWGTGAWLAWIFLMFGSSLLATMIYLILMRDWGASRTGTYAFVSPVFAVLLGTALYGERLGVEDALGMALMLGAAILALRRAPTSGSG